MLAIPAVLSLAIGGVALATLPASAAAKVTASPATVTAAAFVDSGVRITGESRDTGGRIQRQDIEVTSPSGETFATRDFTPDGTFDVTVTAGDFASDPVETGTYSVVTFGFVAEDARATTTFEVADAPVVPPASISVTPKTITPDAFLTDGVQATGRTFDTGAAINRSNIVLTSPTGKTATYFDLTGDGSFDINIKPKGDVLVQPLALGTYTLTATSLLEPSYTATTTFEVAGGQTPPPAAITVTPKTITPQDFVDDGVQASGRTFDSGSEVNIERSDLVLTAPNGDTAAYFDLTSDGTFNVNIKPKGDIANDPVAEGTYTLTATSLQDPSFTATTTFVVKAAPAPPVVKDPVVRADPKTITVSDFTKSGVNLSGFTEDTPGPLTRQEIFVTTPSGTETNCADFTGDGTFNIQVYPQQAPTEGPEGQRTCSLASDTVEVGVYHVLSYGFIREDARATTTFTVVADPTAPPTSPTASPTSPTASPTNGPTSPTTEPTASGTGTPSAPTSQPSTSSTPSESTSAAAPASDSSGNAAAGDNNLADTGGPALGIAGAALLLIMLAGTAFYLARHPGRTGTHQ